MKIKYLLISTLFSLISGSAFAQETQSIPDQENDAPMQQVTIKAAGSVNALRLKTAMTFPAKLKNVKETAEYILEPISYKLVLSPVSENDTKRILARPLLKIHADGTLKSIEDALLKISGDDTILVVDHEHKLVTLEYVDHQQ